MAYGDNPKVHRIEVEHSWTDGEHDGADVRFVCSAPPEAPCRNYPGCECEEWDPTVHAMHDDTEPQPGHENVPHNECWLVPHLSNLGAYDFAESLDIAERDLRSGPISLSWEGDGAFSMEYADVVLPPGLPKGGDS